MIDFPAYKPWFNEQVEPNIKLSVAYLRHFAIEAQKTKNTLMRP